MTRADPLAPQRRIWTHAPAALLAASVLVACTGDAGVSTGLGAAGQTAPSAGASGAAGVSGSSQAGAAGTSKLSFANDIYPRVIRSKCGTCHNDTTSFGGLAFFPGIEMAYANLVGVPSGSDEKYKCRGSGLMRVAPGDPEHSLMYLKITAPPCGSKMPPVMFGQVTPEQVDLVRQWIVEGAAP